MWTDANVVLEGLPGCGKTTVGMQLEQYMRDHNCHPVVPFLPTIREVINTELPRPSFSPVIRAFIHPIRSSIPLTRFLERPSKFQRLLDLILSIDTRNDEAEGACVTESSIDAYDKVVIPSLHQHNYILGSEKNLLSRTILLTKDPDISRVIYVRITPEEAYERLVSADHFGRDLSLECLRTMFEAYEQMYNPQGDDDDSDKAEIIVDGSSAINIKKLTDTLMRTCNEGRYRFTSYNGYIPSESESD